MGHRCERHHRTTQGYLTTYPSYIWIIELQLCLFNTPSLSFSYDLIVFTFGIAI